MNNWIMTKIEKKLSQLYYKYFKNNKKMNWHKIITLAEKDLLQNNVFIAHCNRSRLNFNLKNVVLINRESNLLQWKYFESKIIWESSIVNLHPWSRIIFTYKTNADTMWGI